MAVNVRVALVLGFFVAACEGSPTEVVIVADTDYVVPTEIDLFVVSVTGPDEQTKDATQSLVSAAELPATLGIVHEGGALGPFVATFRGELGGGTVASRAARFTFVAGEIRALRLTLERACAPVICGAEETCAGGACRSIDVGASELEPWAPPARADGGTIPDGGPADGAPICGPTELCNGLDDDCDGSVDEGFDMSTDVSNCGGCGIVCDFQNTTGSCTGGVCVINSCNPGFDDCDLNGQNGCETELGTSLANCGGCGNRCNPPDRACCAGTCARSC
jgi:hypothetical protein